MKLCRSHVRLHVWLKPWRRKILACYARKLTFSAKHEDALGIHDRQKPASTSCVVVKKTSKFVAADNMAPICL